MINVRVMEVVESGGKLVDQVKINSKVVEPDGKGILKPLVKMGGWHVNTYDLGEPGQYQLMVLFKTADGKKHGSGVYYNVH